MNKGGELQVTYSFNDICKAMTGTDASDICTPEKESDWLSVVKHIIAGFSVITNYPDDILLVYDSTFDNLEALYFFITGESVNDNLLDDETDEDVSRNTLMNRAYAHFAKAIAKAYICQNAERDGRKSVSKFLEKHRLETFGQFLFMKTRDFVQIED